MKPIWVVEQANFASHLPEEFSGLNNFAVKPPIIKDD
jgi:hypothetical protein